MKSALRLSLIVVVFAVLYGSVSRMLVFAADGEGYRLARWLVHEARRSEALRQRQREMGQVNNVKKAIAEEFVAGRLTFDEAAERFRSADALIENDREGLVAPYLVPQTEQELCQQVRAWTENVLFDKYTPQKAEQVRHRLHIGERGA